MSQHLIREIQEIKRQLNEVASPDDVQQLEERLTLIEKHIQDIGRSMDQLYNAVIEHARILQPESQHPATKPIDPDETQWMEPGER
jgi:uncharacterized protein YoxC